MKSFSRENEYESDKLGIRYMSRAGYTVSSMATYLSKLRANSRLKAIRRGEPSEMIDRFNYLATHPAPLARVRQAEILAQQTSVKRPMTKRKLYLSKINGILYGGDTNRGFIRDHSFLHPRLRFSFRAPNGFSMFNTPTTVYAFGPARARIIFDRAPGRFRGSMERYISEVWAPNLKLRDLETIKVNYIEAATAGARLQTQSRSQDFRLVTYRVDENTIYRLAFLTIPDQTSHYSKDFRRTTYSFRRLSISEAVKLRPLRILIITVASGDTVSKLATRMPFDDYRLQRFKVLNGLSHNRRLRVGQKLKLLSVE